MVSSQYFLSGDSVSASASYNSEATLEWVVCMESTNPISLSQHSFTHCAECVIPGLISTDEPMNESAMVQSHELLED